MNGLGTMAHAGSNDAFPPTKKWCCRPIMRRHPCGHLDRLTANNLHVIGGTSLPLPPKGEHDAIGGPSGTFLSPPHALCEHGGGMSPSTASRSLMWVNGTLTRCSSTGDNAITDLGMTLT